MVTESNFLNFPMPVMAIQPLLAVALYLDLYNWFVNFGFRLTLTIMVIYSSRQLKGIGYSFKSFLWACLRRTRLYKNILFLAMLTAPWFISIEGHRPVVVMGEYLFGLYQTWPLGGRLIILEQRINLCSGQFFIFLKELFPTFALPIGSRFA